MKRNYLTLYGSLAVAALTTTASLVDAAPQNNKTQNNKTQTSKARNGKAQSGAKKDRGPAMKQLAQQLNLTEAQQARIEPILQSTAKQVRAVRNSKSLSRQQKIIRLNHLQRSAVNRVNAVLNADQRKKFALMLQAIRRSAPSVQR